MRELINRSIRVGLLLALSLSAVAALGIGARPAQASLLDDRADRLAPQTALRLGIQALRDGRQIEADTWLRAAWASPSTRPAATRALMRLHDNPAFRLPIDTVELDRLGIALGRSFRRYETAHFVILSDADPAWTRSRGLILERTRHEFYRFADRLGTTVIPHERKLVAVLFARYDAYRAFALERDDLDASWVAGYYSLANKIGRAHV